MARYDLLKGGLSNLIKDLEVKIEKYKLVDIMLQEAIAKRLLEVIQQEAQTIDYNYQMYSAVYNLNEVVSTPNGIKVINTSQEATYSEYGTGIIGSQTPHPKNSIGWEYDVNAHGEKGWRYKLGDKYYFTKGVPSNPVYLRSAERVKQELPLIIKKIGGGSRE